MGHALQLAAGMQVGPGHVLGEYSSHLPGPLILVSGGMHGNEPAGVLAAERVLARLRANGPVLHGRVVAIAGNLAGLRMAKRYIERDLNRQWDPASIEKLRKYGPRNFGEDLEQLELLNEYEAQIERAQGPVLLLDLHTMSATGVPFIVTSDRPGNRALASQLVLPSIAGLERAIPGTTLDWFSQREHLALGVEGGRHDDPQTVAVLEAITWLTLLATGALAAHDIPNLEASREVLRHASQGRPQQVTVTYRHGIAPEDLFRMQPGFCNLQPVSEGQVLALDARGEVRAPATGWIVLPLYQPVGNDGFFIGTAV